MLGWLNRKCTEISNKISAVFLLVTLIDALLVRNYVVLLKLIPLWVPLVKLFSIVSQEQQGENGE
jgi:hypothetical protein